MPWSLSFLLLCTTLPSPPVAGEILQGPAETSPPSGSHSWGPPALVTTSFMPTNIWFPPFSQYLVHAAGLTGCPFVSPTGWQGLVHTVSERLSCCLGMPDPALCWALGRRRQRCTEFLPQVGRGYSTVTGPTSLSRSLLPGEGQPQGLKAEAVLGLTLRNECCLFQTVGEERQQKLSRLGET